MSFIMMNERTHHLLNLVKNRQLPFLEHYFYHFQIETSEAVESIMIDMYAPYVSLVKKMFPNAQLIIDRFHIFLHTSRPFRNHQIKEINQLLKSKEQKQYQLSKQLKRYWELLQKD